MKVVQYKIALYTYCTIVCIRIFLWVFPYLRWDWTLSEQMGSNLKHFGQDADIVDEARWTGR